MKDIVETLALSRLRTYPGEGLLKAQARTLLPRPAQDHLQWAAAARINLSLLSEHTHYMDGFALFIPLPVGLAAALQPSDTSRIRWSTDGETLPLSQLDKRIGCLLQHPLQQETNSYEGVLLGPIGRIYEEGFLGALASVWHRVLQKAREGKQDATVSYKELRETLTTCLNRPFGIAPSLAAEAQEEAPVLILDTQTREYLPVPSEEAPPAWALFDTRIFREPPADFYWRKMEEQTEALHILQKRGFRIESFRQLMHEELQQALYYLPSRLAPTVQYLVTENRRVQRMTVALRKSDFQLAGGLMLISQASLKRDWKSTIPEIDALIEHLQTYEGLYGARMIGPGFGGQIVLLGQAFALARIVEQAAEWFYTRTRILPETALL